MESKINKKIEINMVIDIGHDVTLGSMEFLMHQIFDVDYSFFYVSNSIFELHKIRDKNKHK